MGSALIEKEPVGELTENSALAVRFAKKMFYIEEAIWALMEVQEGFGSRKFHYSRLIAIMAAGSLSPGDINITPEYLVALRELAKNESTS